MNNQKQENMSILRGVSMHSNVYLNHSLNHQTYNKGEKSGHKSKLNFISSFETMLASKYKERQLIHNQA